MEQGAALVEPQGGFDKKLLPRAGARHHAERLEPKWLRIVDLSEREGIK